MHTLCYEYRLFISLPVSSSAHCCKSATVEGNAVILMNCCNANLTHSHLLRTLQPSTEGLHNKCLISLAFGPDPPTPAAMSSRSKEAVFIFQHFWHGLRDISQHACSSSFSAEVQQWVKSSDSLQVQVKSPILYPLFSCFALNKYFLKIPENSIFMVHSIIPQPPIFQVHDLLCHQKRPFKSEFQARKSEEPRQPRVHNIIWQQGACKPGSECCH